jgi:LPXTG-motif cell wall-anchored protein
VLFSNLRKYETKDIILQEYSKKVKNDQLKVEQMRNFLELFQFLKSDNFTNGGQQNGQKLNSSVFLKSGQNHVIMVYMNRGGVESLNFKINDANTNTFTWYLYNGGIAKEQQIIAQQTAAEQARIKAEQDAINAAQAKIDAENRKIEADKLAIEKAKLGITTGTGKTGTSSNTLLIFGGVGLAILVGIVFMFKKKKR